MIDDEKESGEQSAVRAPSKDITVPDATHTRFRKPMCRCTIEGHGTFPLNTLHDHFTKFDHDSLDTCILCGGNEVYEYYITSDRLTQKIYHSCSPVKVKHPTQPKCLTKEDVEPPQPISQSYENSDAESSGIGTGYSSMASVLNGRSNCDNGKSTNSSPSKSSNSLSDSVSLPEDIPSCSQRRNT